MNRRWKMNRMGFVNFWLYDEETFPFADGKLFLRGANASGKSITTQSFIPFILDGDRSPNRLDPFGSNDRKMEYYFLGNGEKDDVTGYLFLEFKKGDTEQYRTIGVGQRAQKGKPMGFWGFILLDGKRIGYDINLYQEVGSKKIPYAKQDLKKVLGEDNVVVDAQAEYMQLVNKYIFGFPRIEQYDQFIRLMIKVRAPKLSRDFRPTKVYEILNESLQTLSDEDLRAMVDAMEKMDDIQGRLESLKSAFKDLQSIHTEYDRYNRYMLSKKAHAYIEVKKQVDLSRNQLDIYTKELLRKQQNKTAKEDENEQLVGDIQVIEKEIEVLDARNLQSSVEKLERTVKQQEESQKEWNDLSGKIESHHNLIRIYDAKQKQFKNAIDNSQYEIDKVLEELREINETLQFEQHSLVVNVIEQKDVRNEFTQIRSAIKELLGAVAKGLSALKEAAQVESIWNSLEEELSTLNLHKDQCAAELKIAENMEAQCRDSIVENFYILVDKCQELIIKKQELNTLVSYVMKYQGAKDLGEMKNVVDEIYIRKIENLRGTKIEVEKKRKEVYEQHQNALNELAELKAMKEPMPQRRDKISKARKVLLEKGVTCIPFYEAVEFNDKLTQEEQSLLEEQLLDAGLLDALVVAGKDYDQIKAELNNLSDTLLQADPNIHTGFNKLVPADLEPELRLCVEQILDNIYEKGTENAKFVLSSDGYFRNGIIEGHSMPEEKASFVGVQARKQNILCMIEKKEFECNELANSLYSYDLQIQNIKDSIATLNLEYDAIPKFDDLDQAIGLVKESNYALTKAFEECEKKEKEIASIINQKKACEQNVIVCCKMLPFERTVKNYQEVSDSIEEYREELIELESNINCFKTVELHYKNTQELMEKEEDAIDEADLQLKKVNQAIKVYQAEIAQIRDYLNSPENKERANKLAKANAELEEKKKRTNENAKDIAVLESEIQNDGEKINSLNTQIVSNVEKENKVRKYYQEELALGLVIQQNDRTVDECSMEAGASIRDNDKGKSIGDVVASLHKTYQQHISNLTSYGTSLEDLFEDDEENTSILRKRQCIVSTWQGKKLHLEEFHRVLKESIDSTELLIQEKDRDLFENILADTLSRKLSNRISESKIWIKDMSELMQNMDTSMALSFSLEWKPRTAESNHELDTQELEKLLSRDKQLLTKEDIEKVSVHFRSKISMAKQVAEDKGDIINYSDLVREALDYRQWFEFKMYFYRNGSSRKELTNSAFNKFSGGEKAMAMYVPLFAAVNAQYKKSENSDHPRIIALDEAFAGVDDKNISSMFELVQKLDFDYIMNSQALWGCYETVKSLRIAELLRPANSSVVTVIYYYWNGRERVLDEQ